MALLCKLMLMLLLQLLLPMLFSSLPLASSLYCSYKPVPFTCLCSPLYSLIVLLACSSSLWLIAIAPHARCLSASFFGSAPLSSSAPSLSCSALCSCFHKQLCLLAPLSSFLLMLYEPSSVPLVLQRCSIDLQP